MDSEMRRGSDGRDALSIDGNSLYMLTVAVMEEMLDKLKLLDYENGFCRNMGFRFLSR